MIILMLIYYLTKSAYIKSTSVQRAIHMNCVVLELNLEEKDIISCMEGLLSVECQTVAKVQGHCILKVLIF